MNRIKEIRHEIPVSQRQFAFFVGMTPSALANYENGLRKPSIDIGWHIVQGFKNKGQDVSFEDVFPNTAKEKDLAA